MLTLPSSCLTHAMPPYLARLALARHAWRALPSAYPFPKLTTSGPNTEHARVAAS